jgi:16S rRNA (uracil1498-N3)-methyltransferase
MGAARFIPFVSERTVVQYDAKKEAKRAERWGKIVKEAAEQAHRSRIPVVEVPLTWKQVLALAGEVDVALFCYEKAETVSLKRALREAVAGAVAGAGLRRVLVVVGPEGGFAEREAAAAEESGMRAITLGRRILRTETAALVALSCILYECDELGGM